MRPTNDQTVRNIDEASVFEKARQLARVLVDKKIHDVWVVDVAGRCGYADCLILGDAENERHMQAALDGLDMALSRPGFGLSPERGERWTLLDVGDIVVDLFLPGIRGIYRLEDLYADAPIYVFDETGRERRVLPEERLSLYPAARRTGEFPVTEWRAP